MSPRRLRASGAAVLLATGLALPLPAWALPCADIRALLDAEAPKDVLQRLVWEAPPADGWDCLAGSGHRLASLDMAVFVARLDPQEDLRWTVRARRCEAGTELRRGTRRLLDRLENRDDAPVALDEEEVGPGSTECQRVAAIQAAVQAR